jgi:heat shock protein HslJ
MARQLTRGLVILLVAAAASACRRPQPESSAPAFRRAVSGVDWELVELAGAPAPAGAGDRRPTLRFDPDSARAGGFGGCNRYGGSYTLEGPVLRFGPIVMTEMACDRGMELERRLTDALAATRRFVLAGSRLELYGETGQVAAFRRPSS